MLKHLTYITIVLLLGVGDAVSQISSPLNRFDVDYIQGCAPLTVTVTNTSGEINDQYFFDVDTCISTSPKFDAAVCATMAPVSTTTFTYNQPGTYTLVQVLTNLVPRTDTLVIEVFDAQTPQFDLRLCNNYQVIVQINDTYYDQFQVDYGDGSPPTSVLTHTYPALAATYPMTVSGYFSNGPINCADSTISVTPTFNIPTSNISRLTVTSSDTITGAVSLDYILNTQVEYMLEVAINGVSGFTDFGIISGNNQIVPNLNTQDNIYCFRLAALDQCNNTRTYSDTICSVKLDAVAQSNQNVVTWSTELVGFSGFDLLKNGAPIGIPITNNATNTTTDTLVSCDVDYCYQAIARYNNGAQSISAASCVTGISNQLPPTIQSLTASVDGQRIILDWQEPDPINFPLSSYTVNRSINGASFEVVGNLSTIPFTDVNLRPQINTHCYVITYQDGCGNQSSPSATACAILLAGENINNRDFQLNWTPYVGWENGVREYQLELFDSNGAQIGGPISLGNTVNNYTDIISNTRQITQYRIVAFSNDPTPLRSVSNIIFSDIPLQLFLPNSFTPNNDGLNDIFLAKGLFIEEFSMDIYSRWGELLFHSENLDNGWDGIYKGTLVQDGSYVYRITAIDPQNRVTTKSGAVNVLSKPN